VRIQNNLIIAQISKKGRGNFVEVKSLFCRKEKFGREVLTNCEFHDKITTLSKK